MQIDGIYFDGVQGKRIASLDSATALTGAERLLIIQNGSAKTVSAQDFAAISAGAPKSYIDSQDAAYATAARNPANLIQTSSYRLVSDAEKSAWNAKEPAVAAGTSGQYYTGSKTWQTLDTSVVPENGNLYYTQTRFDMDFAAKSTTGLAEGTNLYYNNTRVQTYADTRYLILSGGTLTGDIQQSNLPVNSYSLINKAYVDNAVAGLLFKVNCRAASVINVNISSAPASMDGVTLAVNDRVLLKNQTDATQNGIYVFNGSGSALTRAADANTGDELASKTIPVTKGTVNADTWWTVINDTVVIGTTAISFTQSAGSGTYTYGTGINLTGNVFAIDSSYTANSSRTGYLSAADWSTFNGKQNAIGYTTANDASVVHNTGNESIDGEKSFISRANFFSGSLGGALSIIYGTSWSGYGGTTIGLDQYMTVTSARTIAFTSNQETTPGTVTFSGAAITAGSLNLATAPATVTGSWYVLVRDASTGAIKQISTADIPTSDPIYFNGFSGSGSSGSPFTLITDSTPTGASTKPVTSGGVYSAIAAISGTTGANPSVSAGLTAVNGSATTYMRSDAAPAIDVTIAPTWTGKHNFNSTVNASAGFANGQTITGTLNAVANSDVLTALYINPTIAAGSYTGVVNAPFRMAWGTAAQFSISNVVTDARTTLHAALTPTSSNYFIGGDSSNVYVNAPTGNAYIRLGGNTAMSMFSNGHVVWQAPGANPVDNGFFQEFTGTVKFDAATTFGGAANNFLTGAQQNFYRTSDIVTDTESIQIKWNGTVAQVSTNKTNAGSLREIYFGTGDNGGNGINCSSSGSAYKFLMGFSGTSINTPGVLGGTIQSNSGYQAAWGIYPTVNQSATGTFDALRISPNITGSGGTANFLLNLGTNSAALGAGTHTSLWAVDIKGAAHCNIVQTTVNGSTGGSIICSQVERGASYKKVIVWLNNLTGTAVFTYDVAFTNAPIISSLVSSGSVSASAVNATSISITGSGAATGWYILEGY